MGQMLNSHMLYSLMNKDIEALLFDFDESYIELDFSKVSRLSEKIRKRVEHLEKYR